MGAAEDACFSVALPGARSGERRRRRRRRRGDKAMERAMALFVGWLVC